MFRSISIPLLSAAVALAGVATLSSEALAQHGHGYRDDLHGFRGEAALDDAIVHVDAAFHARAYPVRQGQARVAMQQVAIAEATVRDPLARRELADAYEHLELFLARNSDRDLDLALVHLQTAHDVASRPVVVRRPPVVVRPVPPRPPVVVHPTPIVRPYPPAFGHPPIHPAPGVSFGNDRFRFRISF